MNQPLATATTLAMLCLATAAQAQAPAVAGAPASPWAEFAPILGDFDQRGGGEPGEATGWTTFTADLQGQVLVRRTHTAFAATSARPSTSHDDLLIVYRAENGLRADYFDGQGKLVRYTVSPMSSMQKITFLSEPGPGPRFRITYDWSGGPLEISFDVAQPATPDQFRNHARVIATRRRVVASPGR